MELDIGLPPLDETFNGPEFGFDVNEGIEIVYTKIDTSHPPPDQNWFIARQANYCFPQVPLWRLCWEEREFMEGDLTQENRWLPFATTSLQTAKVLYLRDLEVPRGNDRRVAWRDLENSDLNEEQVFDDPNASFFDWARIDNEDFILTTYAQNGERQVALYDVTPPFLNPRLQILTTGAGQREVPILWLDPATGRYTLAVLKSVTGTPGNAVEVWQRIASVWTMLYDFNSAEAGEANTELIYVQSLEPFHYQNHAYFVFVTADEADFLTTDRGNIRITRVESAASPTFTLLSDATLVRKRTEPEIHYPTNDSPVIFYTQKAVGNEFGCLAGENMLWRARTGVGG